MTDTNRRAVFACALALALGCAAAQPAARPIRLIVPYPPGGPLDTIARTLAESVKDSLGTVVVENRPGAGGNLGADLAAKAAPDGTTLVMGAVATHAINPWLYSRMPYDPIRDFTPITRVAQVPNVLVMNAETALRLDIRSLADLVAYVRRNPGQARTTAPAAMAAPAIWPARCSRRRRACSSCTSRMPAASPAQLALLGGQVDFNFDNLADAAAEYPLGQAQGAGRDHRGALGGDARRADGGRSRRRSSASRSSTSRPGSACSRPARHHRPTSCSG